MLGAYWDPGKEIEQRSSASRLLVHGWDRINNLHFYSLLGLSSHKNGKCYPTMTKGCLKGVCISSDGVLKFRSCQAEEKRPYFVINDSATP